jgi:Glycosyltransferase Family 4
MVMNDRTLRIGIDISQIIYTETGVGTYVRNLVSTLLTIDKKNDYILFGSSFRKRDVYKQFFQTLNCDPKRVTLKIFPFPQTYLEMIWNSLHIVPIEWLIGSVDVFWSSDWMQPPLAKAKGVTTIHDTTVLRFPESFPEIIVSVQKRRMQLAARECSKFLCDSRSTKNDVANFLHIDPKQLLVVYPGFH